MGIEIDAMNDDIMDWDIFGNVIDMFSPATNSIGIWLYGSGDFDGFVEADVADDNIFTPGSNVHHDVIDDTMP